MTTLQPTTRRTLAVLSLLLLVLVPSAHADGTAGGGAKNVVLVVNEADGQQRSGAGIAVSTTAAESVATENLALARASCSDCRTVAVAMQFVPIIRDVDVIAPKNAAVAVNVDCSSCRTAAFAYQYVVTTDGPVHLTAAGRQQLTAIRAKASALAASDLSFPALDAELDELAERFRALVDAELVSAGPGTLDKRVDRSDGDG
jgi:putative peptide zinc metalloprotease protein